MGRVLRPARSWSVDTAALRSIVTAIYTALPPHDRANGRTARILVEQLEGLQSEHIATTRVSDARLDDIPMSVLDAFARSHGVVRRQA